MISSTDEISKGASSIRIERSSDHLIWTIIISRSRFRNSVNSETAMALAKAFQSFDNDETALVGVLCGEGNSFCAGYDLKELSDHLSHSNSRLPIDKQLREGFGPMGPSRFLLRKPMIAAIEGYAVAGGLELALLCDLRVMAEDSIVGIFCRRWGVPLIDGGTIRLPRLIGLSRALDLILTGRAVGAKEAYEIGLANRIVPKGQARIEAEKIARLISSFPQLCMLEDRMSVYRQFDLDFMDALKEEFQRGIHVLQSSTATEFVKGKGRHGSFESFSDDQRKSKL
jgi:enoyl-CoA hydratase